MPPKNKGKKGKKGGNDDDFWRVSLTLIFENLEPLWPNLLHRDKAGESVANNNPDAGAVSDGEDKPNGKPVSSGLAALQAEDVGGDAVEEEEDFGGLMVSIKSCHFTWISY